MTPYDIVVAFSALTVGLLIGSFLNVVIYRFPIYLFSDWTSQARDILVEQGTLEKTAENTQDNSSENKETFNIAYPSSHCPKCKTPIKPWHNIPVFSYFFLLRGKCKDCGESISIRYPIIEAVTGLLSLFVALRLGLTAEMALALVFTWTLIVLTMIDVDHQLLPDDITYPLLWLGLVVNAYGTFTDLNSALFGAVGGYLSLWSVYWLFKIITNKEGMGYGDFKLLAALGAWMGWQALPMIIILSSLVGAIIGIAGIIILGKDKNKPMPFGPYLAIAGWIAFFWADDLTGLYLLLFSAH